MPKLTDHVERITPEHVMLVVLVGLGLVFFTEPLLEDYPDNARVFPQMMSAVVIIGSVLLLARSYLPEPLWRFVAQDVSLTSGFEEEGIEGIEGRADVDEAEVKDESEKGPPLHEVWGYDVNNTVIMMGFSILYFALGWAIGLLYVTPVFVFGYAYWFRVKWYKGVLLAILATAIVYGFVELLLMPFDRGELLFEQGLL